MLLDDVPLLEGRQGRPREPLIAALGNLSGIGLGQVYAGGAAIGLLLLGAMMLTMLLVGGIVLWLPPSPLVAILIWLLPIGDTCAAAVLGWRAARAAPQPFLPRWYNRWYWYLAYGLVAYAALSLGALPYFKHHVVEAFRVPSGSMAPTVLVGDFLMVTRTSAAGRPPPRGAVVVFELVEEPGLQAIKRVVGLVGDTLAMRGGQLMRNGLAVREPYVRHDPTPARAEPSERAKMRAWQIGHFAGPVPDAYNPNVSDWGPLVVPAGMVFLLGDNRDHSYDSRHYGFVPLANVRGRPRLVYWSCEPPAAPDRIRWSRLGHAIE
jgi:signal peptidase I